VRRALLLVVAGIAGLLCAAAIGYAAYAVSRDSVAVPVTQLQPKPVELAPKRVVRTLPRTVSTTTAAPTTTGEDHGGHGGGDNSGHGGGGGGDD
jgi:uncharacterized membrane protein